MIGINRFDDTKILSMNVLGFLRAGMITADKSIKPFCQTRSCFDLLQVAPSQGKQMIMAVNHHQNLVPLTINIEQCVLC